MIKNSLENIKREIKETALKANRNPEDITLIAVSKTYPVCKVEEAIALGCRHFGENHVQELCEKMEAITTPVNWHFIGHLQTNKVKYIIGKTALIHSLDRMKLAYEIEKQSEKQNCNTNVLIEVNVANEASKHGFTLEEVLKITPELNEMSHIKVKGLMTVAPFVTNPEENRKIFRALYKLSVDIQNQNLDNISTSILSMGMSNDYKVAIEEGATMVRIGTALFGQREYNK